MCSAFLARRAIERLRDGLFDPVAVDRLTINEESIYILFSKGLKALRKKEGEHLCLCGSYGQGKSHNILYLNRLAIQEGYAASIIQLKFREVPFHQFPIVYQSIMKNLLFPDNQTISEVWRKYGNKQILESLDKMPFRFRTILTAMLNKNKQLTSKEKLLKKHRDYQPKEYAYWLEKSLMGKSIPNSNLKKALKHRGIEEPLKQSLFCSPSMYVKMVQSMGQLIEKVGYKGLVLFFDEGESIAQASLYQRAKSYALLDHFFQSKGSVYSIFAFTDDFFDKIRDEPYEDVRRIFPKNYAKAWEKIHLLRLQDISLEKWKYLIKSLIDLYSEAYQAKLPSNTNQALYTLLQTMEGQKIRIKLRSLVNKLDIQSQQIEIKKIANFK